MDYYKTNFNVATPEAVALEDSILKKGSLTTAGSKILENFIAPFDATVVERLQNAGIEIAGKTTMPEFGIRDLFKNQEHSRSGAFQAVNSGHVSCCLCNDLLGQYRQEAASHNLFYIHPTYGTVSRYGLIPLAASMDQIGVLCKDLATGFSVLETIAGHDAKDGAMLKDEKYSYQKSPEELTICAPSHIIKQADEDTQAAIQHFTNNFSVVDHAIDYFDLYKQTMYVLSCAEISNNMSRYDGIKFGYRSKHSQNLETLYTQTRTEALGTPVKLTAIMGAMVLSGEHYLPYYDKAMRIRRLVKQALSFNNYNLIILPASLGGNPYDDLSLYAMATLSGLPALSFSYHGCGMQLIANVKNEDLLRTAWEVSQK